MVQHFGTLQSQGSLLANTLGQGIGSGLQEAAQFGLNKSRLQEAFAPLANDPIFANLAKVAPALLSTQGGSQALSEIANLLVQQGLNKNIPSPKGQPRGVNPASAAAQNQPAGLQQTLQQISPQQQAQMSSQLGAQEGLLPLKNESQPFNQNFSIPTNYQGLVTPDQEAEVIDQMRENGALPQQIDEYRKGVDRYNQGLITLDELQDLQFARKAQRNQEALKQESIVNDFINNNIDPQNKLGSDDKQIIYGLLSNAVKNQEAPDLTRAWSQVQKNADDLIQEKQSFVDNIPDFIADTLGFGIASGTSKTLQNTVKPLLKRYPFMRNILMNAILEKGNNIFDAGKILSESKPSFESKLKSIPDRMQVFGTKPIQKIKEDQQKDIIKLAEDFSKAWDDKSSAIETVEALKKKGYLLPVISEFFKVLEQKGLLNPEQRTDLNRSINAPLLLKEWFS
jgi:hypothetical protein